MAIRVQVPGHGIIEFPDGMSQDEMRAAIQSLDAPKAASPSVDAALDAAPSARGAVAQAIGALAAPIGGLKTLRMVGRMLKGGAETAASHPIETGALIGGAAAVPLTGGASLPAALAASGLGGAGGAGLGLIGAAATGAESVPSTPAGVVGEMAKQGAIQAGAEATGRVGSNVLTRGAERLYQSALRPIQALREQYPGLVRSGLDRAAVVSEGGADRIANLRRASTAQANQLVAQAPPQAVPAAQIMPGLATAVRQVQDLPVKRGMLRAIGDYGRQFIAEHPTPLSLPDVQGMVRSSDRNLNRAYRSALDRGDLPAAGATKAEMGLMGEARQVLRDRVPGLKEQNANTQALYGLEKGIKRRVGTVKGFQPFGMQHFLNAGIGAGAGYASGNREKGIGTFLALEGLANPTTGSIAAIGADRLARAPLADAIRAAILARLSRTGSDTQQ